MRKYYFFGSQRVAIRETNESHNYLHYLHWDHLGSTVLTTWNSSGTRQSERAYYAFGDDRRTVNTPLTDNLFTGQKQDESGLYYYNARYYDPEIGHFISPDTIVPDPGSVFGYNRYMYALGNPLKYNDPTGYYSDEALFTHFNCTDWACVEAHFQRGGSHEGLWGWLDILRNAEDDDSIGIFALSSGNEYARVGGRFATIDGHIVVQNAALAFFNGESQIGSATLPDGIGEQAFAAFAYLNVGGDTARSAFYAMDKYSVGYKSRTVDCEHYDCTSRALNIASTGAAVVGASCAIITGGLCIGPIVTGAVIGTYATGRTYNDYKNGGDSSALDVTVSGVTTIAGAASKPVYGPVISVTQWIWDEFSPY
ncbi:MAG: RHS repeat-associated core domain-containing protein [Candidatus Promineofilum sp.]|uniref:RHS repeat-associated core domain-containing protein n=1 Tax=Promineifilum sp. TaxID=2664178 RepID=UPI0024120E82|nr:RHS repeat-associated core domain-containing protein [Promineifilum sp.]